MWIKHCPVLSCLVLSYSRVVWYIYHLNLIFCSTLSSLTGFALFLFAHKSLKLMVHLITKYFHETFQLGTWHCHFLKLGMCLKTKEPCYCTRTQTGCWGLSTNQNLCSKRVDFVLRSQFRWLNSGIWLLTDVTISLWI